MISLAARDIQHSWAKFVLTGLGLGLLMGVTGLLYAFDKVSKDDIDRPGQEVLLPGYINPNNPFLAEADEIGNSNQV